MAQPPSTGTIQADDRGVLDRLDSEVDAGAVWQGASQREPGPPGTGGAQHRAYIVRVNGVTASLGTPDTPWAALSLRSLTVTNRGPRELILEDRGDVALSPSEQPPLQLYSQVEVFEQTFEPPYGYTRVFAGLCYRKQPSEDPNNPRTMYVCLGYRQMASELQLLNNAGGPLVIMVPTSTAAWDHIYPNIFTVKDAIDLIRALAQLHHGPEMETYWASSSGLPTNIPLPTAGFEFVNKTISQAIDEVLNYAPGWTYVVNPATFDWHFYVEHAGSETTISIPSGKVMRMGISADASDRYTAVQFQGNIEFSGIGATVRNLSVYRTWNANDETQWTIMQHAAYKKSAAGGAFPAEALGSFPTAEEWAAFTQEQRLPWVFRRWAWNAPTDAINTDLPVRMMRRVRVGGGSPTDRWVQVKIDYVDYENQVVYTAAPQIKQPVRVVDYHGVKNSRLKGKAKCPSGNETGTPSADMVLVYHTTSNFAVIVRWPPTGYSGTAYWQLGLERTLYRYFPEPAGANEDNARQLQAALGNIRYSGTIEIADWVDADLWNLDRRLNLSIDDRVSELEQMQSPLRSLQYDFARRVTRYTVHSDRPVDLVMY